MDVDLMKRHDLRIKTMECLYQHVLLDKPIFQIITEEGPDLIHEEDDFILKHLALVEHFEDAYITDINRHLKDWSFERLAFLEQAILLLAYSELSAKEDEKAVIIDEAVQLAKTYADDEAYKYINAVLDHYE